MAPLIGMTSANAMATVANLFIMSLTVVVSATWSGIDT
jgi:hypothetical protein